MKLKVFPNRALATVFTAILVVGSGMHLAWLDSSLAIETISPQLVDGGIRTNREGQVWVNCVSSNGTVHLPHITNLHVTTFSFATEREPNNSYLQANGSLISGRVYTANSDDSRDYFSFFAYDAGTLRIKLNNPTIGMQVALYSGDPSIAENLIGYEPKDNAPHTSIEVNATGRANRWYYVQVFSPVSANKPYSIVATFPMLPVTPGTPGPSATPLPPCPTHTPTSTPTSTTTPTPTFTPTPTPTPTATPECAPPGAGDGCGEPSNNSFVNAYPLFVGVGQTKTIYAQIRVPADVNDYHKLPLTQSQKVLITLRGPTNNPDLDLYLVRPGGGPHASSNNI